MKFWLSYITSVIGLGFLAFLFLFIFHPNQSNFSVRSPIPGFLTITDNVEISLLDFWLPLLEKTEANEKQLENNAKAALIFDLTANKTLYEKDAKARLPMASLTKIMTAIISLETKRVDNHYSVSPEDLVGEDSMGIMAGEAFTLDELLYGLMLPSGNDAAEVLARNYPKGGRMAFIEAMNRKALILGLQDTHFSNPSGLQGDGVQHTTAYDLLVITKYALDTFPLFREIVATSEYSLPETDTHAAYYLLNETNLLTTYPGVKGVKTGFTPEAGMCLITYLEYENHQIIGVLLNSPNRRQEMKDLLDYSLKSLQITPPPHE